MAFNTSKGDIIKSVPRTINYGDTFRADDVFIFPGNAVATYWGENNTWETLQAGMSEIIG